MRNPKRLSLHQSGEPLPRDGTAREPLGPVTPDHRTPLGDTAEAHDEIVPEDLPKGHPGRRAAEHQAAAGDGTTRGDVARRRHRTLRFWRGSISTATVPRRMRFRSGWRRER